MADCTPIRHCSTAHALRHKRHWIDAQKGCGGNDGCWCFGCQLLLCVSDNGIITGWVLGPAPTDDRWFLQAMLSSRQGEMNLHEPCKLPSRRKEYEVKPVEESFSPEITAGRGRGVPILADRGFSSPRWADQWQRDYGIEVITPGAKNQSWQEKSGNAAWHRSKRQIVETVIARLVESFDFRKLNAHSEDGLLARIAAAMTACNFTIMCNRQLGRADGAIATLIV